ncbi:hypothetical protein GGI35DRAFT_481370 [Trichoderma velutinum]
MEMITRILLGLVLMGFANALSDNLVERSSPTPTPSWRGSAVLSYESSNADYETPTPSLDEYSSLEPYSFEETWYPSTSTIKPSTTPRPQYSAIATVRTTTWILSRSTTITSVILETYYSTLTDVSDEGGTVTETESHPFTSPACAAASGNPSGYGYECSSLSSSTSSSVRAMTTITWSPEVTAYPPPSISDEGRESPASTSTTSSSASTTTTATDEGTETPPVVTGAAPPPLRNADNRAMGAVVALLAILA